MRGACDRCDLRLALRYLTPRRGQLQGWFLRLALYAGFPALLVLPLIDLFRFLLPLLCGALWPHLLDAEGNSA